MPGYDVCIVLLCVSPIYGCCIIIVLSNYCVYPIIVCIVLLYVSYYYRIIVGIIVHVVVVYLPIYYDDYPTKEFPE